MGVEATLEDSRLSMPLVGGSAVSQHSNVPLNKKAQGKLLPALPLPTEQSVYRKSVVQAEHSS